MSDDGLRRIASTKGVTVSGRGLPDLTPEQWREMYDRLMKPQPPFAPLIGQYPQGSERDDGPSASGEAPNPRRST